MCCAIHFAALRVGVSLHAEICQSICEQPSRQRLHRGAEPVHCADTFSISTATTARISVFFCPLLTC